MKYRANVAAILRNGKGEILVCERLGMAGAWQFPQGGIDTGETDEEALTRELWEETGVPPDAFRIVHRRGPYRYDFGGGRVKKGYHGKEQHYFLLDFTGSDLQIDIATEHPEFQGWKWILPADFQISWLPEMKRDVYRAVFQDFFSTKI